MLTLLQEKENENQLAQLKDKDLKRRRQETYINFGPENRKKRELFNLHVSLQ